MTDHLEPTRLGHVGRPGTPAGRDERLAALRERVRRIEADHAAGKNSPADRAHRIPTGRADVDTVLDGGLATGRLHEWLGVCPDTPGDGDAEARDSQHKQNHHHQHDIPHPRRWRPPLTLMVHLARQAVITQHDHDHQHASHNAHDPLIVWIGARCRPFWPMLARMRDADACVDPVHQSIFVDARTQAERVWATDLALRCPAVAAVIADASGFKRAETRRLQLAAESGSALALLVRPPNEQNELTTASTRWLVSHASSPTVMPQWTVRLLRCKGVRPTVETAHAWRLEWSHETPARRGLPADVVDRPGTAAHASLSTHTTDVTSTRRSA